MAADPLTKNNPRDHFYWPNRMGRLYLLALEDVLGRERLGATLNDAKLRSRIGNYPPDNLDLGWSFEETSAVSQAIDDKYGRQDGRGIAIRTGRAWFYREQRDFGAVLGIGSIAFRLLPLSVKIRMSLNAVADTFNKTSDQVVRVEEKEGRFFYHVARCPECWNRTSVEPICSAEIGLLQESLRRVSGSKGIAVKEILCIARGDPSCTYAIEQRHLD